MSSEVGSAQWRGTEIEARQYYYFYKSLNETVEQERAQLKELEGVTSPSLLKFGIGTKFGGTMGAAWPMKPAHLIELALEVDRIDKLMTIIVKDENGEPDPTDPNGMALILPKLKRLYIKYSVMAYRAYNEPTLRKWMQVPEEHTKESRGSVIAQLLREARDAGSDG